MRFEFDWDPAKATSNYRKHGISFEDAIHVFRDPIALSRLDVDHGEAEERWVTLGAVREGKLLLVVHTHMEQDDDRVRIRIISARRPTKHEARQYEEG